MCQFSYDQGTVILSDELFASCASVAEASFTGHGVSQIFAGWEKLFWPGHGPDWCGVAGSFGINVWV